MLPVKPVGHDHVGDAANDVAALDVADELERIGAGRTLAQRGSGVEHQTAAADRFLAVGQQPDARARQAEHGARERGAHEGELHQVLGPGLGVGAHVEQRDRIAGHGQGNGQGGPVDPAGALDVEQARGERSSGRSAAHERLRATVGDGARRLDDRCLGRRAHSTHGVRGLGDRHRRVHDLHAHGQRAHLARRTEQQHARAATGGQRSPGGDLGGPQIGAVGIDRHHRPPAAERPGWAGGAGPAPWGLVRRARGRGRVPWAGAHDLAPGVEAAHRAHPVRPARAVALRARVQGRGGDLVLGPALGRAGVRLLLLGDGHRNGEG